jgi:MOSC domain-containing protein YiiM
MDVERVSAVAGRGLEGDRYFAGVGTFSANPGDGRELTLIEAEALEALQAEHGIALDAGQTGRNIVTRGVALNELVGRHFEVGPVACVGRRLCDPCRTLERRTVQGVLRGLAGRGGLRADIVVGGEIAVGDVVEAPPAGP